MTQHRDPLNCDVYEWLESPGVPREHFLSRQARQFERWRDACPWRAAIRSQLQRYWNRPRAGLLFEYPQWNYFLRNTGLQSHAALHRTKNGYSNSEIILDPNTWPGDASLANFRVSECEQYLAYSVSRRGSDWTTWRVRRLVDGRELDDELVDTKNDGVTWNASGTGFFYGRFARSADGSHSTQNPGQKLFFHQLGDSQSRDRLVLDDGPPHWWLLETSLIQNGQTLLIVARDRNIPQARVSVCSGAPGDSEVRELFQSDDASLEFIGEEGGRLYFRTVSGNPRGQLFALSGLTSPTMCRHEIIGSDQDLLLQARIVGHRLAIVWATRGVQVLRIHDLSGREAREVELPVSGAISILGRADSDNLYVQVRGFAHPATNMRVNVRTRCGEVIHSHGLAADLSHFRTRQVWVDAADGAKIPLSLTFAGELIPGRARPILMYGYGSHGVSVWPSFSLGTLLWLQAGGLYAVPGVRGGGELGEEWHRAGTGRRKQNSITDFVAAAEWLIDQQFALKGRIAAVGGSAGGLLVAAAMVQRPDLFSACVINAGVLDLLSYERLGIGPAWTGEYGSVSDPDDWQALRRVSPLENVRADVEYPPALVTTGDTDDRVAPAHSYKFVAALQELSAGTGPHLLRQQPGAGHRHLAAPLEMRLDRLTDQLAFIMQHLNVAPATE